MARRPRLLLPGAVYHVMSRGNHKEPIFKDDLDRARFLAIVGEASRRYDLVVNAYCLMGNHYHLVCLTPRVNLSSAMRHVNGVYAQAWNRRHGLSGHLIEARFRSIVVEAETYLRHVARYVVLNPVRAGLVSEPGAWPWSSYRATAGLERPPKFLDTRWLRWVLGGSSVREARLNYRTFVNEGLREGIAVDEEALTLGSIELDQTLREKAGADCCGVRLPRAHRALARPSLSELFGIPTSSRPLRNQRIEIAHVRYGYTLSEIASYLGLSPGTPSMILRRQRGQVSTINRNSVDC